MFEIGDKVRCINYDDKWVEDAGCKIGSIYTVEKCDHHYSLQLEGKLHVLNTASFKLYKEPEFNVDDKVKCVSTDDYYVKEDGCKIGSTYIVKEVSDSGKVMLEDVKTSYWLLRECFEPVTESDTILKFDREDGNWNDLGDWCQDAIKHAESQRIPACSFEDFEDEDEGETEFVPISNFTHDELHISKIKFLEAANDNTSHRDWIVYCGFVCNVIGRYIDINN